MKRKTKYNWSTIQEEYNDGLTFRDICKKYKMSGTSINNAVKRGDMKLRSKSEAALLYIKKFGPRKLTEETKQKLSKIRKDFLIKNPNKVPFRLNHSSKESYPEKLFKEALIKNNIFGWEQHYSIYIYEFDFAFPELKIDVEIDGGTHKQEKVKIIDKKRDIWSTENGWRVIRFEAKKVKNDINSCIDKLKLMLD